MNAYARAGTPAKLVRDYNKPEAANLNYQLVDRKPVQKVELVSRTLKSAGDASQTFGEQPDLDILPPAKEGGKHPGYQLRMKMLEQQKKKGQGLYAPEGAYE